MPLNHTTNSYIKIAPIYQTGNPDNTLKPIYKQMPSMPKVAIIGAGPGGLTLARILQQNGIPSTIFESDLSRFTRNQGGTLDLHTKGGQLALQEAGLLDIFKSHARPEGEATRLVKFDGSVLWDDNEMAEEGATHDRGRPEIDRIVLRDMLLDSIKAGAVLWGRKLQEVKEGSGKGKWDLLFADGTTEKGFDLIVGADGAWSKVRPLLTDAKPFYSGISTVELWCLDVEEKNPWLNAYVGKGSCFMLDEGRILICQRQGDGSIRAYAGLRKPESWLEDEGISTMTPEAVRSKLVNEYFADCGEDLKRVIRECTRELVARRLYMLPVGLKWESHPGVTLIGDAAHLMTPFAGVGVNVAMVDALDLAKALIVQKESFFAKVFSDSRNISVAIQQYETEMFERGRENAQNTYDNLLHHFSAGGGEARAAKLRKHMEMKAAAKVEKTA
jgi:2-polyprenyl-6-methoxyphenol hydroxylase-like FAD-dependent oxidoreductase